jgi:hypothetical protein
LHDTWEYWLIVLSFEVIKARGGGCKINYNIKTIFTLRMNQRMEIGVEEAYKIIFTVTHKERKKRNNDPCFLE